MWHDLHHLWFGYFVPSLWGNGPEALFQTVLYGLIALVFVPPIRHWAERHVKAIHDKLDHHHEMMLQQAESHHEEHMALVQKHHEAVLAAVKPGPKRDARGRFQ